MNEQTIPPPDAELHALDRLVGIWRITGGAQGTTSFRWMEGGRFLIQEGELSRDGREFKVLEIIGREKPWGAKEPGSQIKSRAYTDLGDTLDYVYEVDDEVVTVWAGAKGAPTFCKITVSPDGQTLTSGWEWPGGGYKAEATRIA